MRKPGILPQVSWNLLPTCPECLRTNVNKMRKVQKAKLTDLVNQMEQAEFAAGYLIDVKIAIDSLLLKENSNMKEWKFQMNAKVQNKLYH